jgi:hypothetical protein
MKLSIGLLAFAVLLTAALSVGLTGWMGYVGHRDASLRAIHYDSNYDLSAQRRIPTE